MANYKDGGPEVFMKMKEVFEEETAPKV